MTRRRILATVTLVLLGSGLAVAQQAGRLTLSDLKGLIDDLMSENDAQQTAIDALETQNADLQARVAALEALHPCDGRCIFVTAGTFAGDLGGVSGADAECQAEAQAAGLPGVYKAWISDSTAEAADRHVHSTVPYRLVDGTLVAQDWADLTDGSIGARILLTADGTPINALPGTVFGAWTGTATDGTALADHCSDWMSGGPGLGGTGHTLSTDGSWTNDGGQSCQGEERLYCLEQ